MIWWTEQPGRAQFERAAVADFADRNSWLLTVTWRVADNLQIVVDFDLQVGEQVIPLSLNYPEFFPDAAASIVPRDGAHLSGHQYIGSGELCLQYRPDNWTTEVTGAMMIESAFLLLSSERETGELAPSEHRTTPAQVARNSRLRFLESPNLLSGLLMVGAGNVMEAEIQEHHIGNVYAAQLSRIGPADQPIWVEPDRRGYGASVLECKVVRLPLGTPFQFQIVEDLVVLLEHHGFGAFVADLLQMPTSIGVILFDGAKILALMVLGGIGARKLIIYDNVPVAPKEIRLDPEYAKLRAAKVALVGCGSVGSKVAVHLARSGVGRFVLVDGDVLDSGNLVRNELDWRAVGMHKSQALAARLQEVSADCEVLIRTTILGGQESSVATSMSMKYIADCDLIIDATADPTVYNLCSSIAYRAKKSMCWAQVFGGGVGGIVVRLRPRIDPTPLVARQRIEAAYTALGVVWPQSGASRPYSGGNDAGVSLTADDADVSVIAAHLSRFAIDLLARPDATIFPYSAYLIGMSGDWAFDAPFDVKPIDLGVSDGWDTEVQTGDSEALTEFLGNLFPGVADEN